MKAAGGQRIDKWLWHARFAKTRTAAQALARSGRIRINRVRNDSASRMLKIGDVLTLTQEQGVKVVKVVAFAERRGSAAAARALYDEAFSAPTPRRGSASVAAGVAPPARPDKRDRRLLQDLKRMGG